MKKILSILLMTVLCISLLPISVFAAPTPLNHVDITIELPKGGDPFDMSYIPTVTSFTSGDIDLLAGGAGILNAYWIGDSNGTAVFRSGGTYYVSIKLMFNPAAGYCAAYTTLSTGEYGVLPETFSATVNGIPATVQRNGAIYYPTVDVSLKLEGDFFNAEQKSKRNEEWEELRKARRATYTPRTRAEAETYNRDNMPEKVVVVTDPEGKDLMANRENMTTVVFNVSTADKMAESISHSVYLKEIWLSPEVNPYDFMYNLIKKGQRNVIAGTNDWESSAAIPLYLSTGTVFIPESRVSEFKQTIDDNEFWGYIGGALTIKCYSGDDVIAAQKVGASAAKEICTEHTYNTQIKSADRVCHYADHDEHFLYYYSCGYCGKCEYNPNHVEYDIEGVNMGYIDFDHYKGFQRHGTVYGELPADSVYIGVNAAGEHVWWNTCPLCGVFDPYELNTYDQLNTTGADRPFEEWKAQTIANNKSLEEQALDSTDRYFPGTFSLPLKSDANISAWAQSDVNFALNDNLLDTALLGSDYTLNITRLQFCSVAVKLAEELIGKELTPSASIFSDTDSPYVLKAYGAGITSGTGNGTFSPNATLTRQEMATFIYRTLRYVEQNSDYSYTDYTSKLSNYTDSWAVQSWATEAMAFMNALDLVKGTTDTTLSPDGTCTIEQAITVAERSVYAHLIGWYQVNPKKNMSATSELGKGKMGGYALREGDYVWVTGRRYGVKVSVYNETEKDSLWVPIINPFNGQPSEMKYGDLIPVRH